MTAVTMIPVTRRRKVITTMITHVSKGLATDREYKGKGKGKAENCLNILAVDNQLFLSAIASAGNMYTHSLLQYHY